MAACKRGAVIALLVDHVLDNCENERTTEIMIVTIPKSLPRSPSRFCNGVGSPLPYKFSNPTNLGTHAIATNNTNTSTIDLAVDI